MVAQVAKGQHWEGFHRTSGIKNDGFTAMMAMMVPEILLMKMGQPIIKNKDNPLNTKTDCVGTPLPRLQFLLIQAFVDPQRQSFDSI